MDCCITLLQDRIDGERDRITCWANRAKDFIDDGDYISALACLEAVNKCNLRLSVLKSLLSDFLSKADDTR